MTTLDGSGSPVSAVQVDLKKNGQTLVSARTDDSGAIQFPDLPAGAYTVVAQKDGFAVAEKPAIVPENSNPLAVDIILAPATKQESVEVREKVSPVDEGASVGSDLPVKEARELPNRPATVTDVLPLVPGVARSPGGGLQISGSGEHRSALIVNSADVTDPATGQFGLTVPIDSVQAVHVYQTPFLAEFGRFTAGVVSVETRRGTDTWKWELNDPFPEFRIRSYHLRGLRTATPRINFEGPLIANKLYFSEGFAYEVRKTQVFTLPFPYNQRLQEGFNSFAQLDWIASARHLVTATVHIAPRRLGYVNLDYFNPQATTPDASTHNYTGTVADHLTVLGGVLDNTLSFTRFDAGVWSKGPQDFIVSPAGNSGNYFSQQNRDASRLGLSTTYSFRALNGWGTHNFKTGSYIAGSWENGKVDERPIEIRDSAQRLLEQIAFTSTLPFHQVDKEFALFGQDHWTITPKLAVDLGVRGESQELSEALRFAPRAGLVWSPFASLGTAVRLGGGVFYDRVPLNVYSFNRYPNEIITQYDLNGNIVSGPILYQNGLASISRRPGLVFQAISAGNFSPRAANWSVQVEQPVGPFFRMRVGYMQNASAGLITLRPGVVDPATNNPANLLVGDGRAHYRQFDITAKAKVTDRGELFVSYVRSLARGNLNDFNNYLGSFPVPVLTTDRVATLSTDLPNRVLAWGVVKLPWKITIDPTIEYRSGFPYSVRDATQNYAGIPNQNRFPNFLSVDSRVSKDFKVNPKYTIRLSVSAFNLTNHFNPEAIHSNTGDPAYGFLFGQRGRHFTADFDVVF